MINVDTDRLKEMVRTLDSANRRIDEATNVLMQITTHNNWGCAERHQINDYILQSRKMIQELQGRSDNFYNAMDQLAGQFVETENDIGNMFHNLESVISKILQTTVISVAGNVIADIIAPITSHGNNNNAFEDIIKIVKNSGLLNGLTPVIAPVPDLWEIIAADSWNDSIDSVNGVSGIIGNVSEWIQDTHTGIPWNYPNINISDIISVFELEDMVM